jgi:flagellar hook-length control protein FliK
MRSHATSQTLVETAAAGPVRPTLENLGEFAVKSVRYLTSQETRTLVVRLEPESLGELRLDVTSSESALSVRLAAANPMVREALEGQLHVLREALSREGMAPPKVSVSADVVSGHTPADTQGRQPAPSDTDGNGPVPHRPSLTGRQVQPEAPQWVARSNHFGELDVLV